MAYQSHSHQSQLFVISGPSGAGKGTLIGRVVQSCPHLRLAVSATTRRPRQGEVDGVSYYFLSDEEFSAHIEQGDFLEWAEVHSYRYGTLLSEVETSFQDHSSLLLELDVQGALHVRDVFPDAVLIFIEPPSFDELARRLRTRATESTASITKRLQAARCELEAAVYYDVRIVNDDIERASQELLDVIQDSIR